MRGGLPNVLPQRCVEVEPATRRQRSDLPFDASALTGDSSALHSAKSAFRNRYAPQPFSLSPRQTAHSSRSQDLGDAMLNLEGGRPGHDMLFPSGAPNLAPPNHIRCPTFGDFSPRKAPVRDSQGPVSSALFANGATRAISRKFRMLGGKGHADTQLANLQFDVWKFEDRSAKKGQRDWSLGVRLGPNADGTVSPKL